MNIVFANRWYPPESGWGGVAMHNYTMAHAYRRLGNEVTVVTARERSDVPEYQEVDGIRVFRLPVQNNYRFKRVPIGGYFVRAIDQLIYSRQVAQKLRTLAAHQAIDVVEFAEVNAEGYFYARHPDSAVVVRCHTPTCVLRQHYGNREMPYDTRVTSHCEADAVQRAHALTAPSHDMARVIAGACRVSCDSIRVIPNALIAGDFRDAAASSSPGLEPTVILYVGRLDRVKGVAILAAAIPRVLKVEPSVRFVFVGGDRCTAQGTWQRAELERQLAAEGALANVEFHIDPDQAALHEWYGRADICVVPSMLYESFSYTCAQALAAGKPVIASRIGGIPETVDDHVNGLLVDPGDIDQLAEAIVTLARDPALRRQMGKAGQAKASDHFDAEPVARQTLEVYEQAIARYRAG